MKILVIQLARLGDIYITWPILRALKRQYPESEIHLMTRPRFEGAVEGVEVLSRHINLPTQNILTPILDGSNDLDKSVDLLSGFLDPLCEEKYDKIINLSFSPVSSYLTHYLSHEHTQVSGYTRHSDGFFAIPDDTSAYFYAQVGVDRDNRVHLADIFAAVAGVELTTEDWAPPRLIEKVDGLPHDYIVIHVAASDPRKSFSAHKWTGVIGKFQKQYKVPVILVGAQNERSIVDSIKAGIAEDMLVDLVGKTNLQQLFVILKNAKLLVGGDSAPMHMASFLNIPCLNISFSNVNFWETGPRSDFSYIIRAESEEEVASDFVAQQIIQMLHGHEIDPSIITRQAGIPSYKSIDDDVKDFGWYLLTGIYMQEDFPAPIDNLFIMGVQRLAEINLVMIEQLVKIEKSGDVKSSAAILDRGEEIIQAIGNLVPVMMPVVRWYQTEKLRIGPEDPHTVFKKSLNAHLVLRRFTDFYLNALGVEPELEEAHHAAADKKA